MKPENYFNTFVVCFILALGISYWQIYIIPQNVEKMVEQNIPHEEKSGIKFNLDESAIEAQSLIIVDMSTDEVLFSRNATVPYPLASLAKIVSSLVALDNFPQSSILITQEAIEQSGDKGLRAGENWDITELVKFMLITSSNDAAYAIASSVGQEGEPVTQNFIRLMNSYVRKLGMSDTYFLSSTGLDDSLYGVTGFGTAKDMYQLMSLAQEKFPDVFSSSSQDRDWFVSENTVVYEAVNTNTVAKIIPSLLFSKTGYTNKTGGNLMFTFEYGPHHPIGVVILGSTFEGRFKDAMTVVHSFSTE